MKNGLLIVYSGPSGVGKNTVRQYFINNKDLNLSYSVSMTTRPMRNDEVNGKQYYFVTKDEFKKLIKNNEFLEYAEFINNYYGTPKKTVQEQLQQGKNVLLEIEVQGALQIIEKVKNCLTIFLVPPSLDTLKERLIKRNTESIEIINKRLEKAKKELNFKNKYEYIIVNDDPEVAANKIVNIITENIKQGKETTF